MPRVTIDFCENKIKTSTFIVILDEQGKQPSGVLSSLIVKVPPKCIILVLLRSEFEVSSINIKKMQFFLENKGRWLLYTSRLTQRSS